jgi:hypothetical protein
MFAIRPLKQGSAIRGMGGSHVEPYALRKTWAVHVRFGSLADMAACSINIRFTRKRTWMNGSTTPLSARSRQSGRFWISLRVDKVLEFVEHHP